MQSPLEWRHITGMYPFDVPRAVLHLVVHSGADGSDDCARASAEGEAGFQSAHGWRASWAAVGSVSGTAAAVTSAAPDVVVLHGRGAGRVGRLALRGRVPTVYRPRGGPALRTGGGSLLWERLAARWTSLLVLDSASAAEEAVARAIRAPMLVAHPHDLRKQCAAVTRAHAFGRPTSRGFAGGSAA